MLKNTMALIIVSAAAICFGVDPGATSPAYSDPSIPQVEPAPAPAPAPAAPALQIHGWGWLTMGMSPNSTWDGDYYDVKFQDEWLVDYDAGIKAVAPLPYDWRGRFHLGMTSAYPVLDPRKRDAEFLRRKLALYLIDAAFDRTIKVGNHKIYLEGGFFPVKTNPQAMNLGEYLFRSGTYPQTLYSGFEMADKEKLVGLHASYKYTSASNAWLKGDLFFTCGFRDFPIHDWSPALVVAASPHGCLEVGAGVDFEHLICIDKRKDYPFYDSLFANKRAIERNFAMWVDTAAEHRGDTIIYTFKGIKTMARGTFDVKALFPDEMTIFGSEDLKLYGEIAVLGLKSYPGWYANIRERIPIMFGFNFPAFKLLDTFAIEGEYFPYKYDNTPENVWKNRSPVPYYVDQTNPIYEDRGTMWFDKTDDDWRWSIYVSKKLFKFVRLSGQIASDHNMRTLYMFGPPQTSKYTEICQTSGQWYWMTRAMFQF
jgi:hypothetical protein